MADVSSIPPPAPMAAAVLPSVGSAADLRAVLRQRTAPAHDALEQLPAMRGLAEGRLDNAEYRDYLSRQHRLQSALEAAVRPWASSEWLSCRLVKTAWLAADLRALGSSLADAGHVPGLQVSSHAAALGVLYVLEGSTLGLQLVRKRLPAEHPGLTIAGRFLFGYGARTGVRWQAFLRELSALPCADWPAATAAADATFAAFQQHFTQAGHG